MAVRFLHTADWHLGRTIRNRSRTDEFAAVLDELVRIAVDERVDAVLVAGDVYDSRAPGPDADALCIETLVRLHEAGTAVALIPGNHDSPSRLAAFAPLLARIGVRVVPRVVRPDEGGVVELAARDGSTAVLVAAVPFVPERRFAEAATLFDAPEAWHGTYAEGVGRILDAMAAAFRTDRVNVLLAHLFTDGALLGGGERQVSIGLDYAVSPARLPATAHYVALGHVHRPQPVAGAPAPARYAGSLLQLDFGEADERKSVTIVEAEPGRPARVREVPLSGGRRLVDLRGTFDRVVEAASGLQDAWLRCFVETDGPVPGLADRLREAVPNALDVHLVYERAPEDSPGAAPVGSLAPRDQFAAYYRQVHGVELPPVIAAAFDELLAEVREAEGEAPAAPT
ncbi:MAG TPA: exonuclease SbcCD subunit D, partial [Candidatus Limnocylindrales bacterium]|nr:exonuclease SbcCD subunit D [Candidatus Limnocylindrales bacterium]